MTRNHAGFYLRPDTPCKRCERPFIEHEVSFGPVAEDRTPADFEGAQMSGVYCPVS